MSPRPSSDLQELLVVDESRVTMKGEVESLSGTSVVQNIKFTQEDVGGSSRTFLSLRCTLMILRSLNRKFTENQHTDQ